MNHSLYLNHHHHRQHRVSNLESFLQSQSRSRRFYVSSRISLQSRRFRFDDFKLIDSNRRKGASFRRRRGVVQVRAMDDDDFGGVSFLDDYGGDEQNGDYMYFSSDGDESDGDIILNPIADIDLPSMKEHFVSSNDALTVTAHRFATLGKQHKKHRTAWGVWTNIGLICFLTMLLLLVDWCSWRIVRLPLAPFYLSWPFFLSAVLASCAGYISVPLLRGLKVHQIFISDAAFRHSSKKRTPTLGGLFFIPVGIMVARVLVGFSSTEVSGAALATVAFAAVGLLDDILRLVNNDNNGLSTWIRISLEVAIGIWFSFWLTTTSISSPYGIKLLIPLPPPLGLANLGKLYLLLTPLCFVSMGNGVDLTDGLDGLAGGTAALAFVGMSIAVLPICSDLSVFGASMAGACVGFLLHNRYRASVFMGDTGSFALGAALAAMASCTGMFFPLFVSSGFFLLEALPLLLKFVYFKPTRRFLGGGQRLFSMFPFHHHLELFGFKEPAIVASAYVVSSILAMLAGYIGLISA